MLFLRQQRTNKHRFLICTFQLHFSRIFLACPTLHPQDAKKSGTSPSTMTHAISARKSPLWKLALMLQPRTCSLTLHPVEPAFLCLKTFLETPTVLKYRHYSLAHPQKTVRTEPSLQSNLKSPKRPEDEVLIPARTVHLVQQGD